jgi:hypothetical protein
MNNQEKFLPLVTRAPWTRVSSTGLYTTPLISTVTYTDLYLSIIGNLLPLHCLRLSLRVAGTEKMEFYTLASVSGYGSYQSHASNLYTQLEILLQQCFCGRMDKVHSSCSIDRQVRGSNPAVDFYFKI